LHHSWLWWLAAALILMGTGIPGVIAWFRLTRRWFKHRHDTPADKRRRKPKRRN
jgi:hypothetical protein